MFHLMIKITKHEVGCGHCESPTLRGGELLRRRPQPVVLKVALLLQTRPAKRKQPARWVRLPEVALKPGPVLVEPQPLDEAPALPFPDKLSFHRGVKVRPLPLLPPGHELALVHVAVAVGVEPLPVHFVLDPVSFVDTAVGELHDALAVFLVVDVLAVVVTATLERVLPLSLPYPRYHRPLVKIAHDKLLVILLLLLLFLELLGCFYFGVGQLAHPVRQAVFVERPLPQRLRRHYTRPVPTSLRRTRNVRIRAE
mmetsp:Transcript_30930/g.55366  ORF Transcript_30930/g.55366 Transcript_30930/m.55366 type:complete len:254 (+) Transcript_30930:10-771(+)